MRIAASEAHVEHVRVLPRGARMMRAVDCDADQVATSVFRERGHTLRVYRQSKLLN